MEELTLEEELHEIEQILTKMEDENVSLEDSFALYQEGMERLKRSNALIRGVERKVMVINEEGIAEEFSEG